MRAKKVEFTPPEGIVPAGAEPGETFDIVCTFQVKEGGTVCLVTMGDANMPGYGKENSKPGYGEYVNSMKERMSSADYRPRDMA